mmetsp:Transcript_29547/g.87524  ORF Transcript_29547/g.87524 Transcript_29547/m.87524 type:complete len:283 (-) Transcript_29547:691-1539(-)
MASIPGRVEPVLVEVLRTDAVSTECPDTLMPLLALTDKAGDWGALSSISGPSSSMTVGGTHATLLDPRRLKLPTLEVMESTEFRPDPADDTLPPVDPPDDDRDLLGLRGSFLRRRRTILGFRRILSDNWLHFAPVYPSGIATSMSPRATFAVAPSALNTEGLAGTVRSVSSVPSAVLIRPMWRWLPNFGSVALAGTRSSTSPMVARLGSYSTWMSSKILSRGRRRSTNTLNAGTVCFFPDEGERGKDGLDTDLCIGPVTALAARAERGLLLPPPFETTGVER